MSYDPADWSTFRRISSADGRYVPCCADKLDFGRDDPEYLWTLERPGPTPLPA